MKMLSIALLFLFSISAKGVPLEMACKSGADTYSKFSVHNGLLFVDGKSFDSALYEKVDGNVYVIGIGDKLKMFVDFDSLTIQLNVSDEVFKCLPMYKHKFDDGLHVARLTSL